MESILRGKPITITINGFWYSIFIKVCQVYKSHILFIPLALRIAAARADETALLVDEQAAAVRALTGQVLGEAVVLQPWLAFLAVFTVGHVFFQHTGDSVGAGENRFALFPGDRRAADTAELSYHGGYVQPGPECQ